MDGRRPGAGVAPRGEPAPRPVERTRRALEAAVVWYYTHRASPDLAVLRAAGDALGPLTGALTPGCRPKLTFGFYAEWMM